MQPTKSITVQFQAADFAQTDYYKTEDCPCARAFRRHLNDAGISAGGSSIHSDKFGQYRFGRVVLNGQTLEHYGFSMSSYQAIGQAFIDNPQTQAHIVGIYRP